MFFVYALEKTLIQLPRGHGVIQDGTQNQQNGGLPQEYVQGVQNQTEAR